MMVSRGSCRNRCTASAESTAAGATGNALETLLGGCWVTKAATLHILQWTRSSTAHKTPQLEGAHVLWWDRASEPQTSPGCSTQCTAAAHDLRGHLPYCSGILCCILGQQIFGLHGDATELLDTKQLLQILSGGHIGCRNISAAVDSYRDDSTSRR
ncbi:hypothetical protein MRX96_021229 [Rhipicephalus microplus]